jgi:hypothetical protein
MSLASARASSTCTCIISWSDQRRGRQPHRLIRDQVPGWLSAPVWPSGRPRAAAPWQAMPADALETQKQAHWLAQPSTCCPACRRMVQAQALVPAARLGGTGSAGTPPHPALEVQARARETQGSSSAHCPCMRGHTLKARLPLNPPLWSCWVPSRDLHPHCPQQGKREHRQ